MTDAREINVSGTADEIRRLERKYDVLDAYLLVESFPWWKRAFVWTLWRTPVARFLRRRFLSPYAIVCARLRLRPDAPEEEPSA